MDILLIEYNLSIRDALLYTFNLEGFIIKSASALKEAENILKKNT